MKKLNVILTVFALAVMILACKNETTPEVKTIETAATETAQVDVNAKFAKVEFGIDGMSCAMGCAKAIEKQMAKMDGVKSAVVDFEKELAMVEYDEAKVTPQSLEEAVGKVGDVYKVRDFKVLGDETAKAPCKADCDKACCKDMTKEEKMACAENCKKPCCAEKA